MDPKLPPTQTDPPAPPISTISELAAYQTINTLIDLGAEHLYEKYLDSKVIPFTKNFTIAYLANTLECYFYRHDEGEMQVWTAENEMPQPITDSWARGAVPIKKKLRVMPVEEATVVQPDARSMRSSVVSGLSRVTFKPRPTIAGASITPIEEGSKPKVFALDLPQEVANPEEERLRVDKEKELKRRQEEEQRQKKLKEEEEDMVRKVQKMASDLKNREFTYDYEGTIVMVNPPKADKMPAYSQTVDFSVPEPMAEASPKQKRRPATKDITIVPKSKKTPASEVEFVRNLGTVQPPLLDTIRLNPGVVISEQGRVMRPPADKGKKKATMSRAEYQHMVDQMAAKEASQSSTMNKKAGSTIGSHDSVKKSSVTFSKKELLNEIMDEEDELEAALSRRGSEKQSRTSKKSKKEEEFSPVDRFNMEILKAKDWGVNPQMKEAQVPDRMPSRPTQRDIRETHGIKNRRPRDRPFIDMSKEKTRLPPPPLGLTMGHGLMSVAEVPKSNLSIKSEEEEVKE